MKIRLRPLGISGHAHISLAALLIIVGFGIVGVYKLVASHADSLQSVVGINSEEGCYLSGRVWSSSACQQHCRSGDDSKLAIIVESGTTRRYCVGAVNTNTDQATCVNNLHRRYVSGIGCARRLDQDSTNNARQCVVGFPNYVASTTDYCQAATVTPPPVTPPPVTPPPADPVPIDPSDASATANKPGINTSEGCYLAGRVWGGAECTQTCRSANSVLKDIVANGVTRKYCTNAITTGITEDYCLGGLHRKYVANIGCARRMDQDSTNNARQCQASWPNYVASTNDYCQAATIPSAGGGGSGGGGGGGTNLPTAPAPGVQPPTTTPVTPTTPTAPVNVSLSDKLGQKRCELLGRAYNDKQSVCERVCITNGGSPLAAAAPDNAICSRAFTNNISQEVCSRNLHRVWLGNGCARRIDQKDVADAPQCLGYFPYYNSNFASSARKTGVDVCETSETVARDHEKFNQLGDPALSDAWGAGGEEAEGGGTQVLPPQTDDAKTVTIEKGMSEATCSLLGREWIAGTSNNTKVSGCSLESCFNKEVSLKNANNSRYCLGYVTQISQASCDNLNRKWIAEVSGCAQKFEQDKKAGARSVDAKECVKPDTTYVFRTDGEDKCLSPGVVDKLKAVAGATATPFVALTHMSRAGVCEVRPHKHWNGHACVNDREIVVAPIPTGTPTTPIR